MVKSQLEGFPLTEMRFHRSFKGTPFKNRVLEISARLEDSKSADFLTKSEKFYLNTLVSKLEAKQFNEDIEEMEELLIKKLSRWVGKDAIPVIDLLRVYLLHYDSQKLFNDVNTGLTYSNYCLTKAKLGGAGVVRLILKFVSNLFKHNPRSFVKAEDTFRLFIDSLIATFD